ncbi:hypothetical protein Srot_2123 [Segniliparus rotundus DSM 44985]|uniref:Uncharacterized protein n=1 Tax=Segniliparus rotundus (strain ATCC BAA-972 / CDC 1076 / CIP 108378 / DSM 44985 / JCM 13578) TaxID=640132 RepID=D6Z9E6_SEGRD|nr:hypothetical protein [Segniliparus rotundus]ADG98576.1 hypothetical protein Srot_2123 [Segniliparus rotundus DSM 44985]
MILPEDRGEDLNTPSPIVAHSVTAVSCATAERWLKSNTHNRLICGQVFGRYRSDMDAGRWGFVADLILALDHRPRRIRADSVKTTNWEILGCFLVAWSCWVEGRSFTRIQASKGGWAEENLPASRVRGLGA